MFFVMGNRTQNFRQQYPAIVILGEGLTEKYYFTHLKKIFDYHCTIRPRFCSNTCINSISKNIENILTGNVLIICVFDTDVSRRIPAENANLQKLKLEYGHNPNVILCDSFPTIEYWFLLHFKNTCPSFISSGHAEKELQKFIPTYARTEAFLKLEKWVRDMSVNSGNLDHAITRAKSFGTVNASYSNVYHAIEALETSKIS
jgi:hypothetical protein